jgi:hypothetical protein
MAVGFDGCREIPVFPKRTPPPFSPVVLLADARSNQLYAAGYASPLGFPDQQVDMVAGYDVIEYRKTVPRSRLKQPIAPARSIALELQQKLPIVTAVRNMPNESRNIKAVGPGHEIRPNVQEP